MVSARLALAALIVALHAAATATWGFQAPPLAGCPGGASPRACSAARAPATLPQRCDGWEPRKGRGGVAGLRSSSAGEVDMERVERVLRASSRARDVRDAIALAADAELDREVVLLMMKACRATGEWRRCVSLHRRLGGGDAEAFSVAVGACARWGGARDTWGMLTNTGAPRLRGGLSVSSVCRVWVQANEQDAPAKRVIIPGPSHSLRAAPKGKKGGASLRLRAVRPQGGQREALCMHEYRALAADLAWQYLPPPVLSALIGHPGPAAALATHHGCSEREGRLRLMKARAHTAHAKGALPAVLHVLEEAERGGVVDLHGCSAAEALLAVDTAVASLRHAAACLPCPPPGGAGAQPGEDTAGAGAGAGAQGAQTRCEAGAGFLRIVTGRGLHSEGGVAVIKPAVESLLQRLDVSYEIPEGNSGALDCFL